MKLTTLTPEQVAQDVVDALAAHANLALAHLAPSVTMAIKTPPTWEGTSIGIVAHALASYAISGANIGEPMTYVKALTAALYARPDSDGNDPDAPLADTAADTSWRLVIRAALARHAIMLGADSTLRELGWLAGLSLEGVRHQVTVGELKARRKRDRDRPGSPATLVTSADARRWLTSRGIAGFEAPMPF